MTVVRGLLVAFSLSVLSASKGSCASSPNFARDGGPPTIQLDSGTFVGNQTGNATQFLGIPYALPPTGDLRLRLPVANLPYNGTYNASTFGPICPQQSFVLDPSVVATVGPIVAELAFGPGNYPQSEDCLNLDVIVPTGTTADAKLPVVVWIYGGAFEEGDMPPYPGEAIIEGSLELGTPVVYVAMNYRLSAFGFLPGKEVKEAGVGNLGLQDQRLALRWIQKYIEAFGGDPNRVIIFGQSAGAISVGLQMVTNGGDAEGLFHGGFMQSGSPFPVGDIAGTKPQAVYDSIVDRAGCSNATDTLQCLRELPFSVFNDVSNETFSSFSFQSLNLAFEPLADGGFLKEDPQQLVLKGEVANIPFVTGDCDDEGTLFSLGNANLTTETETNNYIASNYFPNASTQDLQPLLAAYPSDPSAGSPFDTGSANNVTAQYKRLAAFQGDLIFQAPRRFFLQQRSSQQNAWSYLWKRDKSTPYIGSYHGSDSAYTPGEVRDAVINFAYNLDPNGPTLGISEWPKYTTDAPTLFTLLDGNVSVALTNDTYRADEKSEIVFTHFVGDSQVENRFVKHNLRRRFDIVDLNTKSDAFASSRTFRFSAAIL
ncbi:carotenoid ester lipase precursor [Stereum hirsutum FP-91666 SS1]|uniref:carotenoid ester lipase precursor n=1 Tax=Stereum hirsutum (strain FP-91666) TaxID=721885 RepID=UPI00044496D4|nr:carotenoid ester lipase precursor [Stereum hirsutum FP-91666 SS1]EIM86931.1 carotenoid ester lipase precursor [Stereum hirsutum FP-91666 SS1]